MSKKKLLWIGDDGELVARVREILDKYDVVTADNPDQAAQVVREGNLALVVIDHDLRGIEALQLFRQLRLLAPRLRYMMISSENNIPIAVAATKLGVTDFLRKPLVAAELLEAVEREGFSPTEYFMAPMKKVWLQGEGSGLKKMYQEIRRALSGSANIILLGERGIAKGDVAEFIHANGFKKKRKLLALDLQSFRKENFEGHFWAAVQEALAERGVGQATDEEDRCGTLFLDNIDCLEENFRQSIFEYFGEKKGRTDREIITILGVFNEESLSPGTGDYSRINIPPLRERKEDLYRLMSQYLNRYAEKHNKNVAGITPEMLDFISDYEFPGNYAELEVMVEAAVLDALAPVIGIENLPVAYADLLEVSLKRIMRKGIVPLEEARQKFEAALYQLLLKKTGNDAAVVARFLDLNKSHLTERIEKLEADLFDQ